jgi:hypothetical protein
MEGATICGVPVTAKLLSDKAAPSPRPGRRDEGRKSARPQEAGREATPRKRGRIRLSEEARARLLDTGDLSRFELRGELKTARKNHHADYQRRNGDARRREDDRRGNRREKPRRRDRH